MRISELKEIFSYKGGVAPTALHSAVGSESSVRHVKDVAEEVAVTASAAVHKQQLRAAVSNLSLCVDQLGDEVSSSSSPHALVAQAASQGARTAAATYQLICALALEDAVSCCPSFNFNHNCISFFHASF